MQDLRHSWGTQAVRLWHVGTEKRAAVVQEVLGHTVAFCVDEVVRHVTGFSGDFPDVHEFVIDTVVEDRALDYDGAIAIVPHRELDGFFSDLAGFAGVAVGLDAHEGALEVAEGIRADAFELESFADAVGEEIAEGAAAGELDVAVGVAFFFSEEFDDHRGAVWIGDAF